jgi:hypothetical protein
MAEHDNSTRARIEGALEFAASFGVAPHLEAVVLKHLLDVGSGLAVPPRSLNRAALPATITSVQGGGTSDLRAFIAAIEPSGAVSEIPALLYWARVNEGKESANERDVVELYRRAGMRPPRDISQSFRDLCKTKYFRLEPVPDERGAYRLSRAGEDFVLHDLIPKADQ